MGAKADSRVASVPIPRSIDFIKAFVHHGMMSSPFKGSSRTLKLKTDARRYLTPEMAKEVDDVLDAAVKRTAPFKGGDHVVIDDGVVLHEDEVKLGEVVGTLPETYGAIVLADERLKLIPLQRLRRAF